MSSTLTQTLKRPYGQNRKGYKISSDGGVSFFDSKPSPPCRHVDADLIRSFEGSAKPGEVAGFEKKRQNAVALDVVPASAS